MSEEALTAQQTQAFLDEFRHFLESGANRERILETGVRAGTSRARSDRENAQAALNAELRAALENEEATYQLARAAMEQSRLRRQARIRMAYQAQRQRACDRIAQTRDQAIYDLQKFELFKQRDHQETLAALAIRYAGFRDFLTRSGERMARMRSAALKIVGNAGGFRSLLAERSSAGLPVPSVEEGVNAMRQHLHAAHELLTAFRDRRTRGILPGHEAATLARELAGHLGQARFLLGPLSREIDGEETRVRASLEAGHLARVAAEDENYRVQMALAEELEAREPGAAEAQYRRLLEREERTAALRSRQLDQHHAAKRAWLLESYEQRTLRLSQSQWESAGETARRYEEEWLALERDWNGGLADRYRTVQLLGSEATRLFPPWGRQLLDSWAPPPDFERAIRLGELRVCLRELAARLPADPRLALTGPDQFVLPLLLRVPDQASLLLETQHPEARSRAIEVLNQAMLRLLAVIPPGRAAFTIVDPVGLGESFSGFMHLADYEESLIHSKIWTQPEQIDQRLSELGEQMEKVIQMYLRNEYDSITAYNQQAGTIAERYRFLVVADFPNGFSELAIQRLLSIAASGARCGVYALIHWDRRLPGPAALAEEDLRRPSVCLSWQNGGFTLPGQPPGVALTLDDPPDNGLAKEFIHKVGRASIDSTHVEVPFDQIAPPPGALWSLRTVEEVRVPIGRTGATKLQELALGRATRQHALVAGKTGSGKSTLFHVIITNLSLWCSPDDVEFYLIDFKKGVEFKCYATHRLPHARVVAIESDREFGLSVLQRVDEELRRRGDLFRKLGAQDLPGYQRAGGAEPLPRCLLLVDEFQEFFVEDDRIAQTAALLLDRIVRQGRAFGIHAILGSQTLGGAFTVSRATLGQMVVRIALQCNEADSYLILDENNAAARLLSRPGEGIYNDLAGAPEANRPFQVVWLSEEKRDTWLALIRSHASRTGKAFPGPIIFEGNAPAELSENVPLRRLLESLPAARPPQLKAFLGAPNSIKGPTAAEFQRLSGNHLLLIGQREDAALALLISSIVSLAAQAPPGQVRFAVLDGSAPESPERACLERFAAVFPAPLQLAHPLDLEDLLAGLHTELQRRSRDEGPGAPDPSLFFFILGLQRFKKLRPEDEFALALDASASATPPSILQGLIQDGPGLGIHLWISCDAFSNVQRFLGRRMLGEFDMRVAFQMSASDSASFLDSPRAGDLGLNRALFDNDQQGILETFRPYAVPGNAWLEEVSTLLAQRGHPPPGV